MIGFLHGEVTFGGVTQIGARHRRARSPQRLMCRLTRTVPAAFEGFGDVSPRSLAVLPAEVQRDDAGFRAAGARHTPSPRAYGATRSATASRFMESLRATRGSSLVRIRGLPPSTLDRFPKKLNEGINVRVERELRPGRPHVFPEPSDG